MTIRLDHTIVPAKDKVASARFFAEIFGLAVSGTGHFAPVQINESLTFDFADDPELSGGGKQWRSHHYAFHVSEYEFEAIFNRVKAKGIPYAVSLKGLTFPARRFGVRPHRFPTGSIYESNKNKRNRHPRDIFMDFSFLGLGEFRRPDLHLHFPDRAVHQSVD
jgi:hypothetical protein